MPSRTDPAMSRRCKSVGRRTLQKNLWPIDEHLGDYDTDKTADMDQWADKLIGSRFDVAGDQCEMAKIDILGFLKRAKLAKDEFYKEYKITGKQKKIFFL